MKVQDKFYTFLSLFNDCQELAVLAIRDLGGCKFRTAKIRTIVTNIRFEGANENYTEIEPFIDIIFNMANSGFNVTEWINKDKYRDISDDELFKIEELDEVGLNDFYNEMELLGISKKQCEYLYFRESSLKEKANKEILKVKDRVNSLNDKVKKLENKLHELQSKKYIHAQLF